MNRLGVVSRPRQGYDRPGPRQRGVLLKVEVLTLLCLSPSLSRSFLSPSLSLETMTRQSPATSPLHQKVSVPPTAPPVPSEGRLKKRTILHSVASSVASFLDRCLTFSDFSVVFHAGYTVSSVDACGSVVKEMKGMEWRMMARGDLTVTARVAAVLTNPRRCGDGFTRPCCSKDRRLSLLSCCRLDSRCISC